MALVCHDYQPRAAERGVLHTVVREHLEAFLQEAADRSDGTGLPPFVEQEFRDFLACGVLARGFARLRCESAPSSGWCRSPARGGDSARAAGGRG
jgi:hypothetical protein